MSRTAVAMVGGCAAILLTGCRSAFVEADLVNRTQSPITVVEMDYPSASFGTQLLNPGATFHYRFKVLGDGPTKLTYTDAGGHDHAIAGPTLHEGAEGKLMVEIRQDAVSWQPLLHSR